MSDPMMPPGMPGEPQPSEEEMQAALQHMRIAPVEQLVAEVLSALLNSSQVKLGRNDGRLLLDLASVLAEGTRGQVDPELTTQVDEALNQLRMAQVQAEAEIVQAAIDGHVEQNDLPRRPAPLTLAPRETADGEPAPAAAPAPSAASKLWTPGR